MEENKRKDDIKINWESVSQKLQKKSSWVQILLDEDEEIKKAILFSRTTVKILWKRKSKC